MSIKNISSSEQKLTEALEQEQSEKWKSPTLKKTRDEKEEKKRSDKRTEDRTNESRSDKRTVEHSLDSDRGQDGVLSQGSVLQELQEGKPVRRTRRYSFEAYEDQIERVEKLQHEYKQKTGTRLSSSRIVREALDKYLKELPQEEDRTPGRTGKMNEETDDFTERSR